MIYFSLLLVFILGWEIFDLWHRKKRPLAFHILIFTILYVLVNLSVLINYFGAEYSTTIYLQTFLANHKFLYILYFLINIGLYLTISSKMLKWVSKKRQNKKIMYLYLIVGLFNNIYNLFIILFPLATWLLFIGFIFLIMLLFKLLLTKKKIPYLVVLIVSLLIGYYSFMTYQGAVRLQIVLMGYPIKAYKTKLDIFPAYNEDSIRNYSPIMPIPVENGDMQIFSVKNYGLVKIAKYIGF